MSQSLSLWERVRVRASLFSLAPLGSGLGVGGVGAALCGRPLAGLETRPYVYPLPIQPIGATIHGRPSPMPTVPDDAYSFAAA